MREQVRAGDPMSFGDGGQQRLFGFLEADVRHAAQGLDEVFLDAVPDDLFQTVSHALAGLDQQAKASAGRGELGGAELWEGGGLKEVAQDRPE